MPEEQPEGKPHSYKLNFKIKKGYTGVIVGQCVEFPSIIIQGKTMPELGKKAQNALFGYLQAFPDKGKEFIEKYSIPVETVRELSLIEKIFEAISIQTQELFDKVPDKENEWQRVELLTIKR